MFPCLVQAQPGRYLLRVYAKPGARASAFAAPLTPSLTEADLRIAAAPVEGQANAELLRYLDELVERGFRSMTEDHTEYVKDTCYAQVLAADATTTAPSTQSAKSSCGGDRISTRKGRSKNAVATSCASSRLRSGAGDSQQPTGSTAPPSEAVFPDCIEVSLVRGGTSREKTLLVVFPGTRAQLAAILEKESRE
ncbi:putative ACR, YggU family protein [Leishmania guyanensis]